MKYAHFPLFCLSRTPALTSLPRWWEIVDWLMPKASGKLHAHTGDGAACLTIKASCSRVVSPNALNCSTRASSGAVGEVTSPTGQVHVRLSFTPP
ncbi:hypothetical protein BPSP_1626 [Bifidobacterium pseudolongum subsp. pseudolongum]|nr:hypothetical protein BPSP_1626 [Bifidobacterium pseudolongum subsp. pseudolongum]